MCLHCLYQNLPQNWLWKGILVLTSLVLCLNIVKWTLLAQLSLYSPDYIRFAGIIVTYWPFLSWGVKIQQAQKPGIGDFIVSKEQSGGFKVVCCSYCIRPICICWSSAISLVKITTRGIQIVNDLSHNQNQNRKMICKSIYTFKTYPGAVWQREQQLSALSF